MSDLDTKAARSKRIAKTKSKGINRYKKAITQRLWAEPPVFTNVYSDRSPWTCGDSNCVMCGNPRKFWKELTLKEKSDEEIIALEYLPDYDSVESDDTHVCGG